MKRHSVILLCLGIAALVGGAAAGGFFAGRHSAASGTTEPAEAADAPPASTEPVAEVQTLPLVPGDITETISAYGTVVSDPTRQQTVTAPFESRILKILVQPGQQVKTDQPVAEIEPSPDVKLAAVQAQNAVDAAKRDLANTQERFDMKLATNQELQTSQNALRDATTRLADLERRGETKNQTLTARAPGVVVKADATEGQIAPAGAPIVEIEDPTPRLARLGVEARDAERFSVGESVDLTPVGRDAATHLEGKIELIPPRVNAETRLVDILVALPPDSHWLLGSYVQGQLVVGSKKNVLVVPRAAVLPGDEGLQLFTVADGKAVAHKVTLGLQTDTQYEIADAQPPLKAGDAVVTVGNYELEDQMAAATRPAP